MNHFFISLTLCAECIERVSCRNLMYSGTDVWLEVKLQQDLSTLLDSCREVVEVEFHMFCISPFF